VGFTVIKAAMGRTQSLFSEFSVFPRQYHPTTAPQSLTMKIIMMMMMMMTMSMG
jgi:hypothetical protein